MILAQSKSIGRSHNYQQRLIDGFDVVRATSNEADGKLFFPFVTSDLSKIFTDINVKKSVSAQWLLVTRVR